MGLRHLNSPLKIRGQVLPPGSTGVMIFFCLTIYLLRPELPEWKFVIRNWELVIHSLLPISSFLPKYSASFRTCAGNNGSLQTDCCFACKKISIEIGCEKHIMINKLTVFYRKRYGRFLNFLNVLMFNFF